MGTRDKARQCTLAEQMGRGVKSYPPVGLSSVPLHPSILVTLVTAATLGTVVVRELSNATQATQSVEQVG